MGFELSNCGDDDNLEFEVLGFLATVRKNQFTGAFCGYLRLPKGHPWFGRGLLDPVFNRVDVHGGISFPSAAFVEDEIAHGDAFDEKFVTKLRDHDYWWIGFDCAHAGDLVPRLGNLSGRDVYRDAGYVVRELIKLAKQADEVLEEKR